MYGENSRAIRSELSTLLRQHRIQQRIGGAGIHTVPVTTTVADREQIGQLIQRYRFGLLTWCRQALDSAGASSPTARSADPLVQLRNRLVRTMGASAAGRPSLDDLTTPHEFALVDAWRLASRTAMLGEHDFAGELTEGRLDAGQRTRVLKDTAEIIRGLVVLDRRYSNIPGWELLDGGAALLRTAEACAFIEAEDHTVDRRGWRPPARPIDGPARPGIAGVIQAEHNALIHLREFPNALNFRRLLDSQRELSRTLGTRATTLDPDTATRWAQRAATYDALHQEARNIGGHLGGGSTAVAEAANALSRLRRLPPDSPVGDRALRDLNMLFDRIDHRVADIFDQGAREQLYFVRAKVPRIVGDDGQMAHRVRERFMPITARVQTDLIRMVREQLRPPPIEVRASNDARTSRTELTDAITHRPTPRQAELGL